MCNVYSAIMRTTTHDHTVTVKCMMEHESDCIIDTEQKMTVKTKLCQVQVVPKLKPINEYTDRNLKFCLYIWQIH